MDMKKTNVQGQIDLEEFKQVLIRAYMKGENLSNMDAKHMIEELAKTLRNPNRH
ncbi:hypothetical protein [Bacillus sp. PS06]|uniref:hypothetical protein n=1 Tax=Bacillus sp. PS06 TaxID=2764176 RepID=UPI0017853204|nr:hypothetical protein [Bacillus sp. PS06]MBD8069445.1 hypothetical protein [Bacillus sp. PS06]